MLWLIITFLVGILLYKIFSEKKEGFVDPYSLCLHGRALDKQYWWNLTHRRKTWEMRPYTRQIYKE